MKVLVFVLILFDPNITNRTRELPVALTTIINDKTIDKNNETPLPHMSLFPSVILPELREEFS